MRAPPPLLPHVYHLPACEWCWHCQPVIQWVQTRILISASCRVSTRHIGICSVSPPAPKCSKPDPHNSANPDNSKESRHLRESRQLWGCAHTARVRIMSASVSSTSVLCSVTLLLLSLSLCCSFTNSLSKCYEFSSIFISTLNISFWSYWR